jgi:hypothetical protein
VLVPASRALHQPPCGHATSPSILCGASPSQQVNNGPGGMPHPGLARLQPRGCHSAGTRHRRQLPSQLLPQASSHGSPAAGRLQLRCQRRQWPRVQAWAGAGRRPLPAQASQGPTAAMPQTGGRARAQMAAPARSTSLACGKGANSSIWASRCAGCGCRVGADAFGRAAVDAADNRRKECRPPH